MRRLPIEYCPTYTVSAGCIWRNHLLIFQLPHLEIPYKFFFLNKHRVDVGLGHSAQGRIQTYIATISNVVCNKTYHSLLFGITPPLSLYYVLSNYYSLHAYISPTNIVDFTQKSLPNILWTSLPLLYPFSVSSASPKLASYPHVPVLLLLIPSCPPSHG